MAHLSNNSIRLIEYTLVIGGSFYLGALIYPYSQPGIKEMIVLSPKEFSKNFNDAVKRDLFVYAGNTKIIVKSSEMQKWIEPYTRNYTGKTDARISNILLTNYLETIAGRVDIKPVNAKLTFQNNKADVFIPSSPGKQLDIGRSFGVITNALIENKASVSLVFELKEPEITLEKINNLGINTILAKGESDYGKSPISRIHNLKIGMSKFNGTILKPGEEFSFNKILGTVEEADGYQAELVIKGGRLVKELGGGLCQVSTTIFRAAILAGLKITERKPHSFPVQYYNPQGFDSTIYPGVVDLKFVNDTKNHILIQTKVVGSRLAVEIYGSDEDRKIVLDGPVQYDKQPSGAMKAYFVRKIYNGDRLAKEERFNSVYKAPAVHPLERNPLE